jgi:hypothetical protein
VTCDVGAKEEAVDVFVTDGDTTSSAASRLEVVLEVVVEIPDEDISRTKSTNSFSVIDFSPLPRRCSACEIIIN